MEEKKNFIALLVGPSASGKSTIAKKLEEMYGWQQAQSITTRPRRSANETGHIFVSDEEFNKISPEEMVAYTDYAGHKYCATQKQIEEAQIYVIDIDGVIDFRSNYHGDKEVFTFYVETPSKIIAERLKKRGVSQEEIDLRLKVDESAFEQKRRDMIDPVYIFGFGEPDGGATAIHAYVMAHDGEKLNKED